jgi:hypothetical protein
MASQMQNPGVQAGASRNQLGGWLQTFPTASDKQAQMLACRFCLSPSMARDLARLCYGERSYD